jgi:integrase
VLTVAELQGLLAALPWRERMLVLLAAGTGLRRSELFALKWRDIDFAAGQMSVTRSIVYQVVGICKTEASQKPVPLHRCLLEALSEWRRRCKYGAAEDWVFASPHSRGRRPYWPEEIMKRHVRPVVRALAIDKRVGWHTFRHTYSTLLKSVGADLKVMQELLRHASIRVTLDHYTQAITPAKRAAQSAVVTLLFPAPKAAEESA